MLLIRRLVLRSQSGIGRYGGVSLLNFRECNVGRGSTCKERFTHREEKLFLPSRDHDVLVVAREEDDVVRVRLGALTQIFELEVPEETLHLRDR